MNKDVQIIELENEDIEVQIDSYVITWSEILGNPANNKALIDLLTKLLADKLDKRKRPLEASTHTKITYDENGLVVAGEDLSLEDLPELHLENIVDVEATAEEVNKLHDLQATREEIDKLHNLKATTAELDILHGLEATTKELNRLKGLLVASVQLNMLAGIRDNVQEQLDSKMDAVDFEIENQANKTNEFDTDSEETYPSSKALKRGLDTKQEKLTQKQLDRLNGAIDESELGDLVSNKLDKNQPIEPGIATKVQYDENGLIVRGDSLEEADIPAIHLKKISDVITPASELNQLEGLEVGSNELNELKNINGNVQGQIDNITELLPREVSIENKLADKEFVKNWVYDHAGFFLSKDGNNTPFETKQELLDTYIFFDNGNIKRISEHDYTVVLEDETRDGASTVYAWKRDEVYNEGHWVFQFQFPQYKWGFITGDIQNQEDIMALFNSVNQDIDALRSLMSPNVTTDNYLVDKEYVDESISTNTATFRGTFSSLEELQSYSGPKDINDYAYVEETDGTNLFYHRYKYNGTEWRYEYKINNTTFTLTEWNAIRSGITETDVNQIHTNENNIQRINNKLNNAHIYVVSDSDGIIRLDVEYN